MTSRAPARALVLWAGGFVVSACSSPAGEPSPTTATRDTSATGVVTVSYSSLPDQPAHVLTEDLRIGSMDGSDGMAFGDIRGIELTESGMLLVLDYQVSELHRFDLEGRYLGLVARRGEGPREVVEANGIRLDAEGALWINDHGKRRVVRLFPDDSVETYDWFVNGYAYLWSGGVTRDGRVWDRVTSVAAPPGGRREGYLETSLRAYLKSMDPPTGALDSVFVGEGPIRSIALPRGNARLPFAPQRLHALDPAGWIWTARSDEYRLVRLDLEGDTVVVVEVETVASSVSADERDRAIEGVEAFMERAGRVEVDWNAVIPSHKPHFTHLSVDGRGNLWVQRDGSEGPVFDVFTREGEFVGGYTAAFGVFQYYPPLVKQGWLLTLQADSFDVQYVVGARVPR